MAGFPAYDEQRASGSGATRRPRVTAHPAKSSRPAPAAARCRRSCDAAAQMLPFAGEPCSFAATTGGAKETTMDMTGQYRIPAPRERVWAALNDPATLKASLPGCQSLEKLSDREFAAVVVAKVGPVQAKFNGNVTLSDLNPPESYKISGEGKGGAAGFAKGGADVRLTEESAELTVLSYTAKAEAEAPPAVEAPPEAVAAPVHEGAPTDSFAALSQNKFVWAAAAIVVLM